MQRGSVVSGSDARRTASTAVHLLNGMHDKTCLLKELNVSGECGTQFWRGGGVGILSPPLPEENPMDHKEANDMSNNVGSRPSQIEPVGRLRREYDGK